ncbi:MAG TPA: alpha/beta hydrolase [Bacillota bacterium]|nr:alpha/beta hydrolase [Bacillota bacterium]
MQVVVDGLLTSYESLGSGPAVLLLHGWGDTAKTFAAIQKELSKQALTVALDLPGFGGTQTPKDVWGLDEYTQFVAHFLKKIAAPKLKLIVGHSNGGAIAIHGLSRGTLHADNLALLASAGVRGTQKGKMQALKLMTKAGKILVSPLPKSVKQTLRRKLYTSVGSDMLVAEHLQESFKRVVSEDVRAEAAMLTLPTVIVYGDQDDATPTSYGKLFNQAIAGSRLQIVPGAGHFVHLDNPQEVTAALKGLLA